jgi:hypothetical protein
MICILILDELSITNVFLKKQSAQHSTMELFERLLQLKQFSVDKFGFATLQSIFPLRTMGKTIFISLDCGRLDSDMACVAGGYQRSEE